MGPAGLHEVLSSLYSKVISTKGGMDDVTWMVVSGLRWTEEGCKWSLIRVFPLALPCPACSFFNIFVCAAAGAGNGARGHQ